MLLIFSVKESGSFQGIQVFKQVFKITTGFAKLISESRGDGPKIPWVLPPTMSASQLSSTFKLDWIHKLVVLNSTILFINL